MQNALELFSSVIDKQPFFIDSFTYKEFQQLNNNFHLLHERQLLDFFHSWLYAILQKFKTEFSISVLVEPLQEIALNLTDVNTLLKYLQKNIPAFLTALEEGRKNLERNFSISHLKNSQYNVALKDLDPENLRQLVALQKQIFICEETLQSWNIKRPIISGKVEYADLLVFAYAFKQEWIYWALENKLRFLQEQLDRASVKMQLMHDRCKDYFVEDIRMLRISIVYEKWLEKLQTKQQELQQKNDLSPLAVALQIEEFLTTQKKNFFEQFLSMHFAVLVREKLNFFLEQQGNATLSSYAIYKKIRAQKVEIKERAKNVEKELKQLETWLSFLMASFILCVKDNPEFMLVHNLITFGEPAISEATDGRLLPEGLNKLSANFSGFVFLCMTFWGSSLVGYSSYQIPASIGRQFLRHITFVLNAGSFCDEISISSLNKFFNAVLAVAPERWHYPIEAMQEFFRFDEVGMVEKSSLINFLTGLAIHHFLIRGVDAVSSAFAYTMASFMHYVVGKGVDEIACKNGVSESKTNFLKMIAQITAYSLSYRLSSNVNLSYLKSSGLWSLDSGNSSQLSLRSDSVIPAKEEGRLHFFDTTKNLKQQLRKLSLELHPDRCSGDKHLCKEKWITMNAEYEELMQALHLS